MLSKQLVVLDPNLQMPFSLEDYRVRTPDAEKLSALLAHYEFKNLLDFFQAPRPAAAVVYEVLPRAEVARLACRVVAHDHGAAINLAVRLLLIKVLGNF